MSVAIWPFVVLNKINEMKNEMRCHGEDDSTEKAEPNCGVVLLAAREAVVLLAF